MNLLLDDLDSIRGDIKKVIDNLKLAINDWPKPIYELDTYESEIRGFIGCDVTKKAIKSILANIDISKYAWQSESLAQLLEVFELYDGELTLKDIIEDIKDKIV